MRRLFPEPIPVLAPASRWLARSAFAMALLSILATRFGGIPHANGMMLLGIAILLAVLACIAAAGAFTTIWRTGAPGLGLAVKGMMLALLILVWPGYLAFVAARLPVLNDVTTDLADPPSFSRSRASLDARQGYVPAEYDRHSSQDQADEYGDLKSLALEISADEVMVLAQKAATNLGWQVIDSVSPSGRTNIGRIDAIARSFLFHFPDDITIRIRPGAGDMRVDIRSASRVGRHDLGSNARNIRAFTLELEALALAR